MSVLCEVCDETRNTGHIRGTCHYRGRYAPHSPHRLHHLCGQLWFAQGYGAFRPWDFEGDCFHRDFHFRSVAPRCTAFSSPPLLNTVKISTLTIVLGWIICAVLSGCTTPVVPDSHPPEPLIPNLRAVEILQNSPEAQVYGTWRRGDGFHVDELQLNGDHYFTETIMSDISPHPYTFYGSWGLIGGVVSLRPYRKSDRSWVEPLQMAQFKRKLLLLQNAPGAHSDGWGLFECYKKD